GIGANRLALAAEYGEPDRPVERGQVTRLQAARLPFLESQPGHPCPRLDFVVDGHAVTVAVHGLAQSIQGASLAAENVSFDVATARTPPSRSRAARSVGWHAPKAASPRCWRAAHRSGPRSSAGFRRRRPSYRTPRCG